MYIAELLNEMFRQVRGRSNFDHLNFEQQKERRSTRGKIKGTRQNKGNTAQML